MTCDTCWFSSSLTLMDHDATPDCFAAVARRFSDPGHMRLTKPSIWVEWRSST